MDNCDDAGLIWKRQGGESLLETPVFSVEGVRELSPQGEERRYYIIGAADWVTVIPLLESGKFVMVRQWRHGEGRVNVEFPGGVINPGESPREGARRELLEETGYTPGELVPLGTLNPNPALFTNRHHFFLARELSNTGSLHLDDDEFLRPLVEDPETVWDRICSGEYSHALMAACAFLYRRYEESHPRRQGI
ncbi:MAG: NUDIX hydrolase [Spirochaetaceae bacterium]|jgi:8-oxo-dGTP pyrophosphatase MutT (NUDIX family)|nr:NUDIX hydrolase [Spirochaetaceae bacterium]